MTTTDRPARNEYDWPAPQQLGPAVAGEVDDTPATTGWAADLGSPRTIRSFEGLIGCNGSFHDLTKQATLAEIR
ncbi:MAG: hypothetical protein EOR07_16280 [Mesorhizobium sp.]|nr:MAG: hypothetical protein EOR07_16280 [Mesorhizobium sp.]